MHSRPRSRKRLVIAALSVLVAPLLGAPPAAAADFIMWIGPDRGAAGTPVKIYGVNDPAAERTVAWVCDWFPPGPPNQVIGTVQVTNRSWMIESRVPEGCVTGYTEGPQGLVPHVTVLAYGGDGAAANFTLTDTPADCPRVLFLGAHGINEGAEGGVAEKEYWGETIESVWSTFEEKVEGERAEAGDYPRYDVDLQSLIDRGSLDALPAILGLEAAANESAEVLQTQVIDQFVQCGTRTRIVLAGFSLGGWAVDKALRSLSGSPAGVDALAAVAGAGVMGDPAFPPHFCDISPCRQGAATWVGRGYATDAIYFDNGLADRFRSMCLSYAENERDPICGSRANPLIDLGPRGIEVHNEYDESGGTVLMGDFLAGLVN